MPVRLFFLFLIIPIHGRCQNIDVDYSACDSMLAFIRELKQSDEKNSMSIKLDAVLNTRPYQVMFKHYNRPFRPNHLPVDVFKRMILSLKFPDLYMKGENQRADQMHSFWRNCYDSIELYSNNLRQIHTANLPLLIRKGVKYAQSWLPKSMKIPDFYFFIHPNGGSSAFTINGCQGYDFFQLPKEANGDILLDRLANTISHESHHLGLDIKHPRLSNAQDSLAYQFLMTFVAEGSASKLVDNLPGGCIEKIDARRASSFDESGRKVWSAYTKNEQQIFDSLVADFEKIFDGLYNKDSVQNRMKNYWLTGYKGRAYFIGSELYGAVYLAFGKETTLSAIEKPQRLPSLYNRALQKKGFKCYYLPGWLIDKFSHFD